MSDQPKIVSASVHEVGVRFRVYELEDGRRVVDLDDLAELIDRLNNKDE